MKGKKAASAATRRAEEAAGQVKSLEVDLAAVRAERHHKVNDLNDQLRALRSALDQEVERRAAERVEAVEGRRAREVAAIMEDYDRRADQLRDIFMERGFTSPDDEVFARRALGLFDKTLHLTNPDGSTNRGIRRAEQHRPKQVISTMENLGRNPGKTKACLCGRCS